MKKVGELLRVEREKKGLSLHEIGLSLKINPKILKAIEDGDTTQLPAKTFLRGFIRSYAQYLKLDIPSVLSLFSSEFGSTRPDVPATEIDPASLDSNNTTVSTTNSNNEASNVIQLKTTTTPTDLSNGESVKGLDSKKSIDNLLLLFLGLGLIVFISLIINQTNKYQKEKETSGSDIDAGIVTITTTTLLGPSPEAHSLVTMPSSTTTTTLTAAASSTTTTIKLKPTSTTTTTLLPVTTTTNLPPATTTTTLNATTTTTLITENQSSESTTTSTTTTLAPQKSVEVIIEALNKVSIRFATSPGQWQNVELNADQVHVFKSKSGLNLEISDGGAVSIVVNGKDRGVQGIIGKPLKLKY